MRRNYQADDYIGYAKIGLSEGITHAGCWAHARRKFIDAEKACGSNEFLTEIISLIGRLYDVERYARENNLDSEEISELRNKKSRPVLEDIYSMLANKHGAIPPKNKISEAISYTLDNREKLLPFKS